jgi:hypothetical protein
VALNEGFIYKLIFLNAIEATNEIFVDNDKKFKGIFWNKKILKSLWDRMGMSGPVSPFTDYF